MAGTVAMVPEGLVLLTSVAFAVGWSAWGAVRCWCASSCMVETLAR